jgi:hypothetical protein
MFSNNHSNETTLIKLKMYIDTVINLEGFIHIEAIYHS